VPGVLCRSRCSGGGVLPVAGTHAASRHGGSQRCESEDYLRPPAPRRGAPAPPGRQGGSPATVRERRRDAVRVRRPCAAAWGAAPSGVVRRCIRFVFSSTFRCRHALRHGRIIALSHAVRLGGVPRVAGPFVGWRGGSPGRGRRFAVTLDVRRQNVRRSTFTDGCVRPSGPDTRGGTPEQRERPEAAHAATHAAGC